MAFFTLLETDYPSLQNPSKLKEKQIDKVRWIVHLKLRPFHFQIKTHHPSEANHSTDNPSQTDNPSLVWIRPMPRSFGSGNCSLCLFATSRLRRRAMKIKLHVINETSHHTTYTSFNDFFLNQRIVAASGNRIKNGENLIHKCLVLYLYYI